MWIIWVHIAGQLHNCQSDTTPALLWRMAFNQTSRRGVTCQIASTKLSQVAFPPIKFCSVNHCLVVNRTWCDIPHYCPISHVYLSLTVNKHYRRRIQVSAAMAQATVCNIFGRLWIFLLVLYLGIHAGWQDYGHTDERVFSIFFGHTAPLILFVTFEARMCCL